MVVLTFSVALKDDELLFGIVDLAISAWSNDNCFSLILRASISCLFFIVSFLLDFYSITKLR